MDDARTRKIKKVVAGNFDLSFAVYDEFERRYGFFADLSRSLAAFAGLSRGGRILDLGCGSGASSLILAREFDCRVVGIDLSVRMIELGRNLIDDPRVELRIGDACAPRQALDKGDADFDAAFYNASIFIIPQAAESLKAAAACLKPGGILAFSFYPEIRGPEGEDLFDTAFERLGEPRPRKQTITSYEEALAGLRSHTSETREGSHEKPFSEDFILDLFSIPAQSASLFPRLDYETRRSKVKELFATLEPEAATATIAWRLAAGKTSENGQLQ